MNIPASLSPQAMRDCVAKGVKFVHCYTAGFGETGTEEGKRLEAEMVKIARAGVSVYSGQTVWVSIVLNQE